jgi:hypothetical protein
MRRQGQARGGRVQAQLRSARAARVPTDCRCLQAELTQISEQLRLATKQLCRNLKDNPNVSDNLAKARGARLLL